VRADGIVDPASIRNQVEILTIDATGGSYTLTFPVGGSSFTTAPIPYNAGAEQLRQTIQNAIAVFETSDPNQRLFLQDDMDVTVDRYPSGNWYVGKNLDLYVLNFQGNLRRFDRGLGLGTVVVGATNLTGTASVQTRMDGIDYYGIENVNIQTGSGADVINVQGTTPGSQGFAQGGGTAVTNIATNAGDDRAYVSSNSDLDGVSATNGFMFLTGNTDDVRGALNLDLGAGRHRLFISDEASSHADVGAISRNITDLGAAGAGLDTSTPGTIFVGGLAPAGISYKATNSGNFYDGIVYWTGSGNDHFNVSATEPSLDATHRTITSLNTGLGDDTVNVNLHAGTDGFFVLNTSGGSTTGDPKAHVQTGTDNDTVDARPSDLPLIIFGGFGQDWISGGQGRDIILGDFGRVQYTDPTSGLLIAQFGYGGRGDMISDHADQVVDPRWVYSFFPDLNVGGNDTIYGNGGEDILVGGAGGDAVDGGAQDDLIFGDAVLLMRRDITPGVTVVAGAITNPRFQALCGSQIYSTTAGLICGGKTFALGQAMNNGVALNYRDSDGSYAPDWAEYQIQNLYHSATIANDSTLKNSFGSDYIAGGSGDDMIFGGLGNDVIQGDGSIDIPGATTLMCTGGSVGRLQLSSLPFGDFKHLVGACRDTGNNLLINPSLDDYAGVGADGSDYIEGGGGSDVIFGNQGQDDIVGGSSDMFTLNSPDKRPDSPNMIFGGSGTAISRNNCGTGGDPASTAATFNATTGACDLALNGHAHDSDAIVANNGDIVRLVGTGGATNATKFLTFKYDNYPGTERIVPRAISLLDYTPGGPDLQGKPGPISAGDIGATVLASGQAQGSEIHGENGDDFIYGGPGNDILFGDGQNDTMIGGYGNDWMSGGTGDDGMLGDDGRLLTSREGLPEPLIGLTTATAQSMIATGGNLQQALINVSGELLYRALLVPDNLDPVLRKPFTLMPRALYASDIMYGGLGNDMMHGGAGEDAMSGAEAPALSYTNSYNPDGSRINLGAPPLESDFARPFNPGNVLGYNPTTTKFHEYDANDPLRKILLNAADGSLSKTGTGLNWLLNFTASEGPLDAQWILGQNKYAAVPTDGNDTMFGDLGHDWLVGGTGRDKMYGGWGDDMLNMDDNLDTDGGLNDQADTNPSWEDLAFGGAGRDVLFANTGGDRMIDWVGEFNSYVVPFSPFGMNMKSDQIQPGLPQFLYDLSKSDGADQTLAARYGSDPARNGEPFGELGLVLQQDAAYNDQRGSPRDPQAGNLNARRDVLRTSGTQVINSPGTCCDPPVGGTSTPKQLSAPAAVDNNSQTAVPAVFSGPSGSAATFTVTDGTTTLSGSGTIGPDGMLPAVLDVSNLADSTLTATLTLAGGGAPVAGSLLKNTVAPVAPGLSVAAYVSLSNLANLSFVVVGPAGVFVTVSLSDGFSWNDAADTIGASGTISLSVDASLLADGPITATVTFMNANGDTSSSSVSLTKDTLPPAAPAASLPTWVNLNNRAAAPLQVSGEAGATVNIAIGDGTSTVTALGSVGSTGVATLGVNLTSLRDGPLVGCIGLTDAAGNAGPCSGVVSTKDTIAPTGTLAIGGTAPVINGQQATANPNLSLQLAFTDANGLNQMAFSTNGGTSYGASTAYAGAASVGLSTSDGLYTVAVAVTDVAGNVTAVTRSIRLDRTPPVITASLPAPTNGTYYDVGAKITLTYGATDVDNTTTTVTLDGTTTITGGVIDIDTLTSGTHTIVVTSTDALGNTTSRTLTFTIHATIKGLINAVNDGVARGYITKAEGSTLVSQLNNALQPGSSTKVKLQQFVYMVQGASGKSISAAYANLLVNWTNDLIARLPA